MRNTDTAEFLSLTGPCFGALPVEGGVCFRVWAPGARELRLLLSGGRAAGEHLLDSRAGLFESTIDGARSGDLYAYRIDGGSPLPDPASRFQPEGVHGRSEIIDPETFSWSDGRWRGPSSSELVVYELHVGTFTPEGTFSGVRDRISYLRDLGVTAIELMPVADFPGSRGWGYDGVSPFAPSRAYGRPDDLRALVDAAHGAGLAVLLDVVYNHLGPEGAYVTRFNPSYLSERHGSPWGRAVNLDGDGAEGVRQFILDNALHWVREYHFDGLRLDATHSLIDDRASGGVHFVGELAATVRREAGRPVVIHAEDHRNLAEIVQDAGWGLDAVWADDFHHVVRRLLAGDSHSYYSDFRGTARELVRIIRRGWLYAGQHSRHQNAPRGSDPSNIPMRRFVVCLQNHDQVGNRATGERLHQQVDDASWRAASALLLTLPMTPLLFMGQEWAADTPFCYFTDLEPDLGHKVTEGRRREFKDFPEFAHPATREHIPDPQATTTFEASRLRWDECKGRGHESVLALYRKLLALRRGYAGLGASDACEGDAWTAGPDAVIVRREGPDAVFWIVVRLRGEGAVDLGTHLTEIEARRDARILLTTEDPAFATDPQPLEFDREAARVRFLRPGAVVLGVARRGAP